VTTLAPRRRPELVAGELQKGQETAVLDMATGQVVSLNPTAAAIWYLCDGQRDASAIAREVLDVFPDVEPSKVELDVRTLLDELSALGLVV
jgi:hypothetical protein